MRNSIPTIKDSKIKNNTFNPQFQTATVTMSDLGLAGQEYPQELQVAFETGLVRQYTRSHDMTGFRVYRATGRYISGVTSLAVYA